ncbi:MAG: tripartite tricarboxylate transporter substrate binding protein [Comamonadaceae bacterium]|nr:MAG: tripartite tricarboxylate transporter substrate binding protein [Comamonadaceae bacterium]
MYTFIKKSIVSICVGTALAATGIAGAADFPDKPVRIVVPYTPGGFNDTLARTVGAELTKAWSQPVMVDNRPGGNTTVGNNFVAKSAPDGYNILITPLPFSALPGLYGNQLPYDALKDFTPLVQAGFTQNVLTVRNDLPVNSVKELLEYAKKNPGKLNYGSTGSGSSNHLSMELFMRMTDTKMTHIPYKGSAQAVLGILAGDIDVLFDNIPNVSTQIKAGKMKALAVTGAQRAVLFPALPTVAESGVPGYEVTVWFGMQLPAGTPKPLVDKINRDIVKILKQPEIITKFREQGVEVIASTPEAFGKVLQAEVPKWTQLIRDANIKID